MITNIGRVEGLGSRVQCLGFRALGLGSQR